MKKLFLILSIILNFLYADIKENFPKLEGRVIDQVNILSSNVKEDLNKILKEEEDKTSNQIVVVILKSLNGYSIEDYSLELGRFWGIGQKDKNNGVLIVVSMEDRKIRIEVGYGLEGALTDKISHEIIEYTIKPNFKAKQYELGILKAVNEIKAAIQGEYVTKVDSKEENSSNFLIPLLMFGIILISMFLNVIAKDLKHKIFFKFTRALTISTFFTFLSYIISPIITEYYLIVDIIVFIITFIFTFLIAEIKTINNEFITSSSNSNVSTVVDTLENVGNVASGIFEIVGSFSGGGGSFGGGGASGGW